MELFQWLGGGLGEEGLWAGSRGTGRREGLRGWAAGVKAGERSEGAPGGCRVKGWLGEEARAGPARPGS